MYMIKALLITFIKLFVFCIIPYLTGIIFYAFSGFEGVTAKDIWGTGIILSLMLLVGGFLIAGIWMVLVIPTYEKYKKIGEEK